MNVYEVPAPDRDGARRIAKSIYAETRDSHAWGARFPEMLNDAPLDVLSRLSPREMRRAILNGFGNARLAGRDEVSADDVVLERSAKRRTIGF
jgi:ATP-dependent Lon protease